MLHSTSWLSSCVTPVWFVAEINAAGAESHGNYGRPAAELVLQLEGDWGPTDNMQGCGWALLLELSGPFPCKRFDDGLTTGAA